MREQVAYGTLEVFKSRYYFTDEDDLTTNAAGEQELTDKVCAHNELGDSPASLVKSATVWVATPQGRRLGTAHPSKSRTQNLWILDPAY